MDNRYYEKVVAEMQSFLDENGFKAVDNGFENENRKIAVKYVDEKQSYVLLSAVKDEEGNFGELSEINSWLFDDSQNEKDAVSVGMDFVVTLRKELGIKRQRAVGANVELPTATKSGNMTITGFTKKMLDVFPVLKEDYKSYVVTYGNFLYINFFGEYLVPQVKALFNNGTKKQYKKLFDVLNVSYVKGDKDTVNITVAILAAAAYNDEKSNTAITEMLAEDKHFLQSYQNFLLELPKSKKLFKALVK